MLLIMGLVVCSVACGKDGENRDDTQMIVQTEQEEIEEEIENQLTYTTQFSRVNQVSAASFQFEYPESWKVVDESITSMSECVIIENERGAKITFSYLAMKNPGGYSTTLALGVDVSKVADSAFVPGYVSAKNYSDLGKFIVAELKITSTMDMKNDVDYTPVSDGSISYAVLPESEIGEHMNIRDLSYLVDFSFDYGGLVAFIADSPSEGFTEKEKHQVIDILSSFRVEE